MWLASRSCAARRRPGVTAVIVAAAWQHGPGSVRRPPTAHAGNAPCARTRPLPRRLRDGHADICLSARYGAGFPRGTDRSGEVAARNRLRSRSGFAVPRRAPTAVGGRSQARRCTCAALSAVEIVVPQSMITGQGCRLRSAGLGRPRTSEASHALRPPWTPRGKTGGAIPRGETQRGYERSTFSGSRKSSSDGQGRRCVGSRTAAWYSAGPPRGNR